MMRLIIFFLFLSFGSIGQIGTGQWRLHIPAKNAIDVVAFSDRVYGAYQNGVTEYNYSSNELSIWDAVTGLNDITVSCLGHSSATNAVFIGYENGNIDKIKDNTVTNIPAIKLAQIQGSKVIHEIVEYNGYMYFATGFAIVKIDPIKNEVKDTYYPTNGNESILDLAFMGDSIFALTSDRLYKGNLNNIALADPTQWAVDARVPILAANSYSELEEINNELFFVLKVDGYGLDTLYKLTTNSYESTISETFEMEIEALENVNDKISVCFYDGILFYNQDYSRFGGLTGYSSARPLAVDFADDLYWVADGQNGLMKFTNSTNYQKVEISGPPKNSYYAMDWANDKLAVAGGGLSSVFTTFNSSGVYLFENESWQLKDMGNMSLWTEKPIWDIISVAINPNDKDQIAVGSYSEIPLSIFDASGQVVDTLTPYNSNLENTSLSNGWSIVSGLEYDESGNLWVINGYTNQPLKVYTSNKQWVNYDLGIASKNKFVRELVIDYNKHKWFAVKDNGLFGFNDNGTIENTSDDSYINLNTGSATGALPSNEVTAIAVDFDNEIWIGTDNGFAVLYNSESAVTGASNNINAQRIKLEFEGNVEYVLGATNITDIVVDGANRKWFGTANSGIILLSPDGLEIIEHHTIDNSPLISNAILDLELDQNTGELFIITDQGLISYRTDATYEDSEYENVQVFPNPARPEFDGPITIQGIRYNSDVKITDISGRLVYKTSSNGGTATWNGRSLNGDKVATGVYLIWTAANEGKGRKVGKVLIVND